MVRFFSLVDFLFYLLFFACVFSVTQYVKFLSVHEANERFPFIFCWKKLRAKLAQTKTHTPIWFKNKNYDFDARLPLFLFCSTWFLPLFLCFQCRESTIFFVLLFFLIRQWFHVCQLEWWSSDLHVKRQSQPNCSLNEARIHECIELLFVARKVETSKYNLHLPLCQTNEYHLFSLADFWTEINNKQRIKCKIACLLRLYVALCLVWLRPVNYLTVIC